MSKDQEVADSKVFTVYSWFQTEMCKVGRKIKFPKCSDKTKTYQFRWTKNFVNKCYNELDLNDEIVYFLISDMVGYAKNQKLLNKGTQILCMSNIIDICYQGLENMAEDEVSLIEELTSCHNFLYEQTNDKDILVHRLTEAEKGCSNLLYWHNLGYLTEVYMALSKNCSQALTKLPKEEKEELPTQFELFRICTHVVSDDLLPRLKVILGSDLRIPPTIKS